MSVGSRIPVSPVRTRADIEAVTLDARIRALLQTLPQDPRYEFTRTLLLNLPRTPYGTLDVSTLT
jgi:hypothetical protein